MKISPLPQFAHAPLLSWLGLALFGTATVFTMVTLPVEFDASNRALATLALIRDDPGLSDQTVALARSGTGFAAFFELAAGRGAPFVNAAARLLANAAPQRRAARRAVVGAAHAAGVFGDRIGQARRHGAAAVLVLVN